MMNASFAPITHHRLPSPHRNATRSQDEMIPNELYSIEHLRLLTPTRDSSRPKDYRLLPSPSSPRMTSISCKRPRQSCEPRFNFIPLHRPSKIQKDDKILFVPSKGLSGVRFPSLPDMVMAGSSTRTSSRDLSQLPCPKNIRLTPRRQTRRY